MVLNIVPVVLNMLSVMLITVYAMLITVYVMLITVYVVLNTVSMVGVTCTLPTVAGQVLFSNLYGPNDVLVELDELSSGVPSFLKSDNGKLLCIAILYLVTWVSRGCHMYTANCSWTSPFF